MSEQVSVQEAVAAVMADIHAVGKDSTSGSGNWAYKYRGIEAVTNALHPLLARHGVVIVPRVASSSVEWVEGSKSSERLTAVTYEFEVFGPAGDSFVGSLLAEGVGQRDKSAVIASSYAWRQFVCLLFAIPTEDQVDPEQDSSPVRPMRRDVSSDARADGGDVVSEYGALPADRQREFVQLFGSPTRADPVAALAWIQGDAVPSGVDPETGEVEPEQTPQERRTFLRAEVMALRPVGWSEDQFEKWMCREATRLDPSKDYSKWRHLQGSPEIVTGLLERVAAGEFDGEPFDG